MKMIRFRMWLASIDRRTWAYIAVIAGFIAVAVACLFVWMHFSGYSFAEWLERYWHILALAAAVLIAIIMAYFLAKMKRGKGNGGE